jgi:hypothetical protein
MLNKLCTIHLQNSESYIYSTVQYNTPNHILLGNDFGASGIPPKVVQSPAEYATGHMDTFFYLQK